MHSELTGKLSIVRPENFLIIFGRYHCTTFFDLEKIAYLSLLTCEPFGFGTLLLL